MTSPFRQNALPRVFVSLVMAAALCCTLLLSGCAAGVQMPKGLPDRLSANVASYRSPNLHSGSHFAFWVWRGDDGTWHLRTTSARVNHRYQGIIHPDIAGSIKDLKGVNLAGPGRRGRGGD